MGRPKKIKEQEQYNSELNVIDIIKKEYGDIIFPASDITDTEEETFSISPIIDLHIGGAMPVGATVICAAREKRGKCLRKFSKVYTPDGYQFIQDLREGDIVLTPYGKSEVMGTYYGGYKDIYRIEFTDGDYVDCDLEHLWEVRHINSKTYQLLTTEDIINKKITNSNNEHNTYKWKIRLPKPLSFRKRKVNIPPYLLGILIGDGGITESVTITNTNKELLHNVNTAINDNYELSCTNGTITYRLVKKNRKKTKNYYKEQLKEYGLHGCNSHTKFIPEDYLFNTKKVRIELLNGLIDTDGHVSNKSNKIAIEYSTTSKRLADDIKFLVNSLGGMTKVVQRYTKCNGKKFLSYRLNIKLPNNIKLNLINYKHHNLKQRKNRLSRSIKNITKIKKDHVYCIKIKDERGLFLTDNCVVTHNTSIALWSARNFLNKYPQGHVYYFDLEYRLRNRGLNGIRGLDKDRVSIINPPHVMSAEEHLAVMKVILNTSKYAFVILDSTSALCPETEYEGGPSGTVRDSTPKLMGSFLKQVCGTVRYNKNILWCITHVVTNTSGYGASYLPSGGLKLRYYSDLFIMDGNPSAKIEYYPENNPVGQLCNWNIMWSPKGVPNQSVTSYLKYGYGIDEIREVIDIATTFKIINKGGAWYSYKDKKWQGMDSLYEALSNDKELYNEIYSKLQEIYKWNTSTPEDNQEDGNSNSEIQKMLQEVT